MSELLPPSPPSAVAQSLSPQDIEEFRALLDQTGVHLDTSAAWKRATQLVSLVRMLLGPLPEDPRVQRQASLAEGPVDG
jgi:hypothetical protein